MSAVKVSPDGPLLMGDFHRQLCSSEVVKYKYLCDCVLVGFSCICEFVFTPSICSQTSSRPTSYAAKTYFVHCVSKDKSPIQSKNPLTVVVIVAGSGAICIILL